MPTGPLPAEIAEFLRGPNPCTIATIRPDGELHSVATWYELQDDGTVLVNMDEGRLRLKHMRLDPRVALTVLDAKSWYSHVSLIGHVREIRPDPDLADIDRLSLHYYGYPFKKRDSPRWTAILEITRWHAWGALTS